MNHSKTASYESNFLNMKRLFDRLAADSHPEAEGFPQESVQQLFEYMLLNNISDLVLACTLPAEQKVRLIDGVLQRLPMSFSMDADTFLDTKANDRSFQSLLRDAIITTDESLGRIWFFILLFGEKTHRQEDCLTLMEEYLNMMCGIEAELASEYPRSGFGRIARDQAVPIIRGMGKQYA